MNLKFTSLPARVTSTFSSVGGIAESRKKRKSYLAYYSYITSRASAAAPAAMSYADPIHAFLAEYESQLSLTVGRRVKVLEESDDGWWYGEAAGQRGLFPVSYCRLVLAEAKATAEKVDAAAADAAAGPPALPSKGAPSEWEALVQLLASVHLEQYASELRDSLGVERVHDLAHYVEREHLEPPHVAMKPVHRSKMLRLIGAVRAGRVGAPTRAPASTTPMVRPSPVPIAAGEQSWRAMLEAQRGAVSSAPTPTARTPTAPPPQQRIGLPRSAPAAAAVAALGGSAATAALPLGAFVIARNPRFSDMAAATRFSPRYWLARVVAVGGAGRCRLQWFVETALGSARYMQTTQTFVKNAMHLQRLAHGAMLYGARGQQWKCFPSPLFVGDRALSVPLPIISNALLATSTVELTATLNLAMRDGFAAEGWAKSRIAGALEYAAQMQRATLEAVIELFQLDVCAARYADAVPGSTVRHVAEEGGAEGGRAGGGEDAAGGDAVADGDAAEEKEDALVAGVQFGKVRLGVRSFRRGGLSLGGEPRSSRRAKEGESEGDDAALSGIIVLSIELPSGGASFLSAEEELTPAWLSAENIGHTMSHRMRSAVACDIFAGRGLQLVEASPVLVTAVDKEAERSGSAPGDAAERAGGPAAAQSASAPSAVAAIRDKPAPQLPPEAKTDLPVGPGVFVCYANPLFRARSGAGPAANVAAAEETPTNPRWRVVRSRSRLRVHKASPRRCRLASRNKTRKYMFCFVSLRREAKQNEKYIAKQREKKKRNKTKHNFLFCFAVFCFAIYFSFCFAVLRP